MPLVAQYVDAWVRANRVWIRVWRSDVIEEERLEFASEFSAEPRIDRVPDDGFLIVFEVTASSRRWKDWAVYMLDDVCGVFPEVHFERFE